MTLRRIDWKQATQPRTLQQVVSSHRGLFIDRPLNVHVVLIDQPAGACRLRVGGCRGAAGAGGT